MRSGHGRRRGPARGVIDGLAQVGRAEAECDLGCRAQVDLAVGPGADEPPQQDASRSSTFGWSNSIFQREPAGPHQRGVELLGTTVRGGDHDGACVAREAVEGCQRGGESNLVPGEWYGLVREVAHWSISSM